MKDKIVAYSRGGGIPYVLTFLGNQWWRVSRDDVLEPLIPERPGVEPDYRYLCELDEPVKMIELAPMMGCVLDDLEDSVKADLNQRMKELFSLGVKVLEDLQYMNLKARVFVSSAESYHGKFGVWCADPDRGSTYFYLKGFGTAADALGYVKDFAEFFQEHGVKCTINLQCNKEVLGQLEGETSNINVNIMDY